MFTIDPDDAKVMLDNYCSASNDYTSHQDLDDALHVKRLDAG